MGPLAKLVGNGIGLYKEGAAHRAQSMKSEQDVAPELVEGQAGAREPDEDDHLDEEESQWELGDLQEGDATDAEHDTDESHDIEQIVKTFFERHPPPSYTKATGDLELPVILPQKRPQAKARGFINAYAPILEDCDIDQKTWMEFLDGFSRAIKLSKGFHAVNGSVAVASRAIAYSVPSAFIITKAVAWALHITIEASRRGYIRYESNKYLDDMNEGLFRPRGLYAMIITFKPYNSKGTVEVDWNTKIDAAVSTRGNEKGGKKLGGSSGKTFKDLDVPEAAPLIFPELDAVSDEKKPGKVKDTGKFLLGDYYDRRSRAKFEKANPDSRLNVLETPDFASRFSDPNHPSRNGNIISLISGGKVPIEPARVRARKRRDMLIGDKTRVTGRKRGGVRATVKRQVFEDIVYLMVVNMPSEEEMNEAVEAVKQAAKQKPESAGVGDQVYMQQEQTYQGQMQQGPTY